jgi:hypothetical protein
MILVVFRKRRRRSEKNLFHDVISCQWLLLYLPFIISASSIQSQSPIVSSTVTDFSKHKFGKHEGASPTAIWVYTGTLIDPLTGTDVCSVEGIELIQSIGHTMTNVAGSGFGEGKLIPFSRFRRRCRNLRVFRTLEQQTVGNPKNAMGNESPGGVFNSKTQLECHTFLSRKCFCYCSRDNKQLLLSLHRRRNGPKVKIPFHQAVSCYDSVVSCIGFPSSPNATAKHATWLHSERPGGKHIWSRVVYPLQQRSLDEKSLDAPLEFSIFARRRSPPLKISGELCQSEQLPGNNSTNSLNRPTRLRLIQWGSSQQQPNGNDFGVRETYQFTSSAMNPHKAVVRYTRHGEAPAWYGPGRMCQLELTGMRVDPVENSSSPRIWKRWPWNRSLAVDDDFALNVGVTNHVPIIFNVIQRNIPNFWKFGVSTNPTIAPEWKQSLYKIEKIQRSPRNDERDFLYYANALHTELQLDIDGSCPNINDEKQAQPASMLPENKYHQFYADLAVGRQLEQVLQQPLKVQPQQFMNPHLDKMYRKLSSAWDKIRAATSLSIGTQRD